MELSFSPDQSKESVFEQVKLYLDQLTLMVKSKDDARPWGGFFVIDPESEQTFLNKYFPEFNENQLKEYGSVLSPKILVVAPNQRLSWQYHNRRAELWKVVSGPVGVVTSDDDKPGQVRETNNGETVQFGPTIRHRLAGLDNWGIVAEIWQHTDVQSPSDEDDIVRVQDDYARN